VKQLLMIALAGVEEFSIALGSIITTGYSWQVAYDSNALDLLEKHVKNRRIIQESR